LPLQIVSYRAWTLIHRANIWISRDDKLQYMAGAVTKALADVDAALRLTDAVSDLPEGKAARFIALLKSVHILTQTKQQVGETPTPEDSARNLRSIAEAKQLFPKHESVSIYILNTIEMSC
jgi:transposase InsO family protein